MIYGARRRPEPVPAAGPARVRRVPVLPVPGGGQHLQQPVHVADVADAVLAAAERPRPRAGLRRGRAGAADLRPNCCAPPPRAVGSRTRFVPVPLPPVIAATRGYELVSRHPRIRAEQMGRLAEDKAFAIDAAARDLGYAPRSFADGIRAEAAALGLAAARAPTEESRIPMEEPCLASPCSPLAPVLGQRVPLRGPARLLFSSYARAPHRPGKSVGKLATATGDVFDVDLSSFLEWQLWAFGSYEMHFAELLRRLAGPGDRCVDVGANVGVHTVRLAKLAGRDGEVIAIEPDPELAGARPPEHRAERPGQRASD